MNRFILAFNRELLIAEKQGESWNTRTFLKGANPVLLAVDPHDPNIIYCATFDRALWKTYKDALDQAFKNTGVDRSEFTATKWAKDQYGKSVPVEYRSKKGAEVSIDYAHYNVDRDGNWVTEPDAPHVGWQTPGKKNSVTGHIIVDSVSYGR